MITLEEKPGKCGQMAVIMKTLTLIIANNVVNKTLYLKIICHIVGCERDVNFNESAQT